MLLVRDAAAHDAEMAALLDEIDQQRRDRMRATPNVGLTRWLEPGIGVDRATDVPWTYTPTRRRLLVLNSGSDVDDHGDFICDSLIAALLGAPRPE